MATKKHDPLESIIGRHEDLDRASLGTLVTRLARERRLLHSVFNTLREGILVIDAGGVIEYANQSATAMLGLRPREDGGAANLWKSVPDLARTLEFSRDRLLLAGTGVSRELELSYPERRLVRLTILPFSEEVAGASLARFAVILADITQEKSRSRREIADERVDAILQLAAGVAHELGNPLNSLTIHLQVMERQLRKAGLDGETDKLMRSLRICTGEVSRLDGIISHFLQAVRPNAPDLQELDLVRILEEALEFLGPELESASILVDVSLDAALPAIMGDRNQLKQVFYNLFKNARQAMKSGGTIKVRATSDDEFVTVRIGDTGEGISAENLGRVFQPYFTTKKSGHGLGMMIVERIVRAHGGSIGLDSREGVGTVVTLQFPQKHRRVRLLDVAPAD